MIEMVVKLLGHKNPYTGPDLRPGAGPLVHRGAERGRHLLLHLGGRVQRLPDLSPKLFLRQFSDWLKAKYGSEEKLRAGLGAAPCRRARAWPSRTSCRRPIPGSWATITCPARRAASGSGCLDTAQYLHEAQNRFYAKFLKAVRLAGYEGPLVGSPWQAPSMLPHYDNLRSDYLVGYIDRHNYFGGGLFDSMLAASRQRLLLQWLAASDRSALRTVGVDPRSTRRSTAPRGRRSSPPTAWACKAGTPRTSSNRSSAGRTFADRAGWQPWGVWDADVPTQIGQFPTLARMIYRGDVRESDVISVRRVNVDDLAPGQVRLLRQGGAAGRRQELRRQRPARGPGRGPGGGRVHRHAAALDAARHGQVPPRLDDRLRHRTARLEHGRQGLFHRQHAGHEGGGGLRRGPAAGPGRRDDHAPSAPTPRSC